VGPVGFFVIAFCICLPRASAGVPSVAGDGRRGFSSTTRRVTYLFSLLWISRPPPSLLTRRTHCLQSPPTDPHPSSAPVLCFSEMSWPPFTQPHRNALKCRSSRGVFPSPFFFSALLFIAGTSPLYPSSRRRPQTLTGLFTWSFATGLRLGFFSQGV